jgi:hypothetical protein
VASFWSTGCTAASQALSPDSLLHRARCQPRQPIPCWARRRDTEISNTLPPHAAVFLIISEAWKVLGGGPSMMP